MFLPFFRSKEIFHQQKMDIFRKIMLYVINFQKEFGVNLT